MWFVVSPDGGPIATSATVNVGLNEAVGAMLVDSSGRTLYLFTRDERDVSNCAGGCALAWPPVLTVDSPTAGEGVAEDRLNTISRSDGAKQVTFNGYPLYYFAANEKPGDTNGQDVGGVWYLVSTDGSQIQTNASINIGENESLGSMLVDLSGRSLYLFSKDEPGVSSCIGGCALAWPPVITVDAPAAGEESQASRLGTTRRPDGSKQVTFDGWPLYYYAKDDKPGDANGQAVGDVWWVVSPETPLLLALAEDNASGQSGWAKLTRHGDRTLVELTMGEGDLATELVHIHSGSCSDLGGVAHALTSFVGGSGASLTIVEVSLDALMTGGFAINSHQAGEASVYTACGNIPATADSLTITLGEMNGSGQTGFASLNARGGQTEVVLSATAGISELSHIHTGSCSDLGGVAHGLTNMAGGASVTTVDATLASLSGGGFAINLHTADDASVYSSCGDI